MLYNTLCDKFSDNMILVFSSLLAFGVTFVLLAKPFAFLPRDGGKFVIDADGHKKSINENSNGKVTGAGLVFVIIYLLTSLLFLRVSLEMTIYAILSTVMMITGFLDDASGTPWGELVKGILDLVLSIITVVVFLIFNSSEITFLGESISIPVVVYAILGIALIWGSINVTNCSDGVDGLCGTVTVIELFALVAMFGDNLGQYSGMCVILAFVLVAYLAYNWYPSTVLMGDAGSRTIGFTLALMCMKSGHPFVFLLLSFVFLFDGGLGLLKLAIMRSFKKPFLSKITFPFHDELRKKRGMRIPLVVLFFSVWEVIMFVITEVIIYLTGKS